MSLDAATLAALQTTFLDESFEGLDRAEDGLLHLEANASPEVIGDLFRAIHSIKGGAGAFGVDEIGALAHVMENVLDDVRSGATTTPEIRAALLAGVDALRRALTERHAGRRVSADAHVEIIARLTRARSSGASADPAPWRIAFAPHPHLAQRGNDALRMIRQLVELGGHVESCDTSRLATLVDPTQLVLAWTIVVPGTVTRAELDDVFSWVDGDCDLSIEQLAPAAAGHGSAGSAGPGSAGSGSAGSGSAAWAGAAGFAGTGSGPGPGPGSAIGDGSAGSAGSGSVGSATGSAGGAAGSGPGSGPGSAAGSASSGAGSASSGAGSASSGAAGFVGSAAGSAVGSAAGSAGSAAGFVGSAAGATGSGAAGSADSAAGPGSSARSGTSGSRTAGSGTAGAGSGPAPSVPAAREAEGRGSSVAGSVRVGIDKIDLLMNMVGELVITQSMLGEIDGEGTIAPDRIAMLREGLSQLARNTRALQESVVRLRSMPIGSVFGRLPRLVHDLSAKLGKEVDLELSGQTTELDKTVLEKLGDPLVHIVRNSIDHGLEMPDARVASGKPRAGRVKLHAEHLGSAIVIEISDDGKGLDHERILATAKARGMLPADARPTDDEIAQLIFAPGFSTAQAVTDISGRGVGMDVVWRHIKEVGGDVRVESTPGQGTRTTLRLPLTLAIIDGQLIRLVDQNFVVPLLSIVETVEIDPARRKRLGRGEIYRIRDQNVPIVDLGALFDLRATAASSRLMMIVETDDGPLGLVVDELLAQQQVVIKSLETNFERVDGLAGATILGDGRVAFIIDIVALPRLVRGAIQLVA